MTKNSIIIWYDLKHFLGNIGVKRTFVHKLELHGLPNGAPTLRPDFCGPGGGPKGAQPLKLGEAGIPLTERKRNELAEFLQWPEFQDLEGTIQQHNKLRQFVRAELREWSKRELLLGQWRRVADSEDDAKFLDLIPTMIPQTIQSSFLYSVMYVSRCLLFMTNPGALLVSNFAIFSTCIGVFGIQSLLGTLLDPIFMSIEREKADILAFLDSDYEDEQFTETLSRYYGRFPVLEAGLPTLICTSSLFFVDLHMARVFARTMTLVVAICLLHGLLVIPVMFSLCNTIWR
ncbi:hypothetical protein niasHT_004374 [Heterodera trifolii]|uniref:Uncharacterized protein n=1 Tax=Heterodera trifolii TaxID=157864 RepID=A0ABD2LS95_9BILA